MTHPTPGSSGVADDTRPVERFRPTSGRLLGLTGVVVCALLLVYVALTVPSLTGLRVGLALAFVGVLIWTTQLRPRATAYRSRLVLRNSFRDTTVPLHAVEDLNVRRMLNVWVAGERYVCIGIGRSLRSIVKRKPSGPASLLGFDKVESYSDTATPPRPDQSAMSYADFVETRLTALVEEARRRSSAAGGTTEPPRHSWAWPEIGLLAVTGAAFVVSLLL
jgi:hypothetical protein